MCFLIENMTSTALNVSKDLLNSCCRIVYLTPTVYLRFYFAVASLGSNPPSMSPFFSSIFLRVYLDLNPFSFLSSRPCLSGACKLLETLEDSPDLPGNVNLEFQRRPSILVRAACFYITA